MSSNVCDMNGCQPSNIITENRADQQTKEDARTGEKKADMKVTAKEEKEETTSKERPKPLSPITVRLFNSLSSWSDLMSKKSPHTHSNKTNAVQDIFFEKLIKRLEHSVHSVLFPKSGFRILLQIFLSIKNNHIKKSFHVQDSMFAIGQTANCRWRKKR